MIATLKGIVAEKLIDVVVLDVGGVGYGVYMPIEEAARVQTGEPVKIYTYEYIRENIHDLFGFMQLETKRFFEQLLDVNGVGPKMALSILNIGSVDEVRRSIASGNTKFIQAANGVGKRLAERLVVELKDKVGLPGVDLASSGILQSEEAMKQDDALQALVALGYSVTDAATALASIDKTLPVEQRIKDALRTAAR